MRQRARCRAWGPGAAARAGEASGSPFELSLVGQAWVRLGFGFGFGFG